MNELSKDLKCVLMRSGIEIWLENEKAKDLQIILNSPKSVFVEIDGETINSADVSGIFTAERMEDLTRRKNGQWRCSFGFWHERFDQCAHAELLKYNKA
jgi:hypothetical protein